MAALLVKAHANGEKLSSRLSRTRGIPSHSLSEELLAHVPKWRTILDRMNYKTWRQGFNDFFFFCYPGGGKLSFGAKLLIVLGRLGPAAFLECAGLSGLWQNLERSNLEARGGRCGISL